MADFQNRNTTGNDYTYDANSNLRVDLNKNIDRIRYNYLNLPEYIHIKGKGTINYVYDAGGTKYQKIVTDSTKGGLRDKTTYIGAFVYHSDTLQFMGQEEGRVRYVNKINQVSGQPFAGMVYDYFLKDHLGNTRMVLTEEQDTTIYVATEEQKNATVENQLFNNVSSTQTATPAGFEPSSGADTSNHFVSKLNGGTGGHRIGPSIVLKVMARDTISANVYGWYQGAVQPPPSGETPLINDLLSLLSNDVIGQSGGHLAGSLSPVSNALGIAMPTFLGIKDADDNASQPKAFLNWVLFDDQLNYVTGNVAQMPLITGSMSKQLIQGVLPTSIPENGYLYIYLSNESQQDVFFDNLNIQYRRGPLLEETHYYPFGLTMAGISDEALKNHYAENKYRFQKQELQNKEFSDGSGFEMYEFKYRFDDPQIGRFWSIDPLASKYEYNSPYAFSENKVINGVELEGLEWSPINIGVGQAFRDAGISSNSDAKQFVKDVGKELLKPKTWAEGYAGAGPVAGAALVGIFTGGLGSGAVLSGESGAFVSMAETPTMESLTARADEIHSALPSKTQNYNTTAVASATTSDGQSVILVGSNESNLRPSQMAALKPGEIAVSGPGHAETTIIDHADANGMTVHAVAASRPICNNCAVELTRAGAVPATPLKSPDLFPNFNILSPPPPVKVPFQ